MQKAEILKPCPCGSGINFESCCQPHILGLEQPLTAEKLLRSRYTAFVAGETDYIMSTHHPEKIKEFDKQGIIDWAKNSVWNGLEVISTEQGSETDDEGIVEFKANYIQAGATYNHHEKSLFKKADGKWYFYDVQKNQPIRIENKIGRNDPCSCGSGKKLKKCCGK